MLFADVILPLPLAGTFTYSVPDEFQKNIKVGTRVIVQFGKKKYYTGIIFRIYKEESNNKERIKSLISVLDEEPIVLHSQLIFWEWISFYYMCPLGDVFNAALPTALKLESESYVIRNNFSFTEVKLSQSELKVLDILPKEKPIRISDLEKQLKIKNIAYQVKSLSEKKYISVTENVRNLYTPKTQTLVSLAKEYTDKELHSVLNDLQRAKKQYQLFVTFLSLKEEAERKHNFIITKAGLLDQSGVSLAILNSLIKKGLFILSEETVSRFGIGVKNPDKQTRLNPYQENAYENIKNLFHKKSVVLLHGVTSSGKTEIYIRLIKDALDKGKQVLYLLPEIALTTQITERLTAVFGDKISVYHSRFNNNERAEIWTDLVKKEEGHVILGARSAIFLPFKELDLIIVDEEHESSYKQQDPSPRYNARDAAIVLANIHKARVLLGTATPSVETYYNATNGKYGLVTLTNRFDDIDMPAIIPVNTKELKRKKQMKTILSPPLIKEINNALSKKEQVILFQNRRGFAPMIECKICSWTPSCEHCDVSLTYHKGQHIMICHYCGATYSVPSLCPNCETQTLHTVGYGTERIEEEVKDLFPEASIVRMDTDTTRAKKSFAKIISDFENKKTDILIGTQMVSKGLDFDNVSIVGIINADSILNYPDFRAHEKAFQLMTQVSGRAGRKNKQGLVMLQTSDPQNPVISYVINNDYKGYFNTQIDERRLFLYPPFYRLISIVMKSKSEEKVNDASQVFARYLQKSFGSDVLGPVKPPVSRIQSLYIRNILLKLDSQHSPQKVREAIKYYQKFISDDDAFHQIIIYFDVDPLS